jgi:tetratricopeptide (TPR) repeat protein
MRHGVLRDSMMGPAIYSEGEDEVERAWEAKTQAARDRHARKALDADLDNIDAYTILAFGAKTLAERLALLREAVRVGDRLWAPCLDDEDMAWWGFIGTRPYLRAMHNLGDALVEAGDWQETEEIFARMLALNPNDNTGARGTMARILMEKPQIRKLRALLRRYDDDMLLEMAMAQFWLDLRAKSADPAKLCPAIDERNAYVLRLLVGQDVGKIETSPFGITMGGADEAAEYVAEFGPVWARDPAKMAAIRACIGTG